MATNRSKMMVHRMYSKLEVLSPDYDQDCLDCTQPGQWSSAWMVIALSNLLNIPVKSVYPAISGSRSAPFKSLNYVFKPPFSDPEKGVLTIMWTNTAAPKKNSFSNRPRPGSSWAPNHFVPLVDVPMTNELLPGADDTGLSLQSSMEPTEKPSSFHAPNKFNVLNENDECRDFKDEVTSKRKEKGGQRGGIKQKRKTAPKKAPSIKQNTQTEWDETICAADEENLEHNEESRHETKQDEHNDDFIYSEKCQKSETEIIKQSGDLSTIVEETEETTTPVSIQEEGVIDIIVYESCIDDDNETKKNTEKMNLSAEWALLGETEDTDDNDISNEEIEVVFQPGPLGNKYMEIQETIKILEGPHTILSELPMGRKDGMYFIIDNQENIERRGNGINSRFWDDCGAWKNSKTPTTYFLHRDGRLRTIVTQKIDGRKVFCWENQVNKKRVYTPLEPQPSEDELLQVHRLYQTLVANDPESKQFKRRITWMEKVPITMAAVQTQVAVVEYIGTFPARLQHGNVKKKKENNVFIRTKDSVLTELKNQLRHDTVKTVERNMNEATKDDFKKHRNEKQLDNLKYNINRNRKSASDTNNAADHVISVEEMTKTHPFVKSVKHMSGINYPLVTLLTDQQITDIKRFCCIDGGSVLCIDKTFNLGEFHVTPTVYKDLSVIRAKTKDHPLCFGPTFIHTSSTTKAYSSFMHDIADNLTNNELEGLIIGSDEEAAFKSAISRCFVGATHVLCTRHLKQNTNRYLEDQVGYPLKDRQEIISRIFDKEGLADTKDDDTYTTRLVAIRQFIDNKDSKVSGRQFRPYFDGKLLPLLVKHIIEPARMNKIPINWTNNNSESANHILKQATQWRLNDLPKFIGILHKIVESEQTERTRAIRGTGSFLLSSTHQHHAVDIDHWASITEDQRQKRTTRFLNDKGKYHPNVTVSTDGSRTIQIPASAGKKTGQRKRPRADRTLTPNPKRRLLN